MLLKRRGLGGECRGVCWLDCTACKVIAASVKQAALNKRACIIELSSISAFRVQCILMTIPTRLFKCVALPSAAH